jgi:mono/diheme cytochrome c family protein
MMIINHLIFNRIVRVTALALFLALLFALLQACGDGGDDGGGGDNGDPDAGKTSACLTDNQDYVNSNYTDVNITPSHGGQLYDKWWAAAAVAEPGPSDHDMWTDRANNPLNTSTGSDTYRCKECHGWDYKGASGAYGPGSSHYTGFPGIDGVKGGQAANVFCAIWGGTGLGTGQDERHSFNTSTTGMSQRDVLAITKFILAVGSKGLVDTDEFINSSNQALGNATAGETVYTTDAGCGNTSCHGANGDNNLDGHLMGELATENPWEVLHKIRYGNPGSVMPSFIDDRTSAVLTETQIKDVLAYVQTMSGSSGGGDGTVTGDVARGGQLYDKWWVVTTPPDGFDPNTINPLFTTIVNTNPVLNIQTPADLTTTWRCKHCHGWDYAGKDGAYNSSSSNFTGVKGLLDVVDRPADELRALISDSQQGEHAWGANGYLSDQDIEDLVAFIKNGVVDSKDDISLSTKKVKVYDEDNGLYLYQNIQLDQGGIFTGICKTCHGVSGNAAPPEGEAVQLGPLALDNPWEVLHKIRFGQPGTAMPQLYNSRSLQDAVDILGYVQTLP